MKWTNIHKLPDAVAEALKRDDYDYNPDPKVFSVTELIQPVRMTMLYRRHRQEIEKDVSENFFIWLGNIAHNDLARADVPDALQEERLYLDLGDGYKLSGKADYWQGEILVDFKLTSVWAVLKQDKAEWEAQLNGYKALYENAGFPVKTLAIMALLRDWRVGEKRKYGRDYPSVSFFWKPIPQWRDGAAFRFFRARLDLAKESQNLPDFQLPLCTSEERWLRDEKWAVMDRTGKRKSAYRLLDSEAQALDWISRQPIKSDKKYVVEYRPGVNVRCSDYCDVCQFCDYWHNNVKNNERD